MFLKVKNHRLCRASSEANDAASLGLNADWLEQEIEGLERFCAALEEPAWQAVVRYLGGKLEEKEHARSSIPVQETIKHAMAQGQCNQIVELCEELGNARVLLEQKKTALSDVRRKLEKINKKALDRKTAIW